MNTRTLLAAITLTSLSAAALAGRRDAEEEAKTAAKAASERGPAASAAEIPALAALLQKAGWEPTPELSGVFKAGSIFEKTAMGDRALATGCFSATPQESTYTAAELVTSLQAGVSVGAGVARGEAYAGIVKKVKFGTPTQVTIPGMELELSSTCTDKLKKLPESRLQSAYVVQEVLKAEISEQTCGKVDARGSFVGLGAAEAEYAAACAQTSLEPVAVGYRKVALAELMSLAPTPSGATVAPPVSAPTSVATPATPVVATAAVNFGPSGTLGVEAKLREQRCDEESKAKGAAARTARLSAAEQEARSAATAAWKGMSGELESCTQLKRSEREDCVRAVEGWLSQARSMSVSIAAGEEPVQTACGARQPAYEGERRVVAAAEVGAAESLLVRLQQADAVVAPAVGPASSGGGAAGEAWAGASGYRMRAVPAGTYEVGCTAGQSGCGSDEKPSHRVKLTHGYLMGETEVTQGLWQRVMGSNPSKFTSCGPSCPVENVSWVEAVSFANKLSARDGLQACYSISDDTVSWSGGYSCNGYRLPTEAEWEVAARGGRDTHYAGGAEVSAVAWFGGNSNRSTHPAGKLQANAYGLYDMSGNVWEWVWDWYGPYSSALQVDPQGATNGSYRVYRGGGWRDMAGSARVAYRSFDPIGRSGYLGFRLTRTNP